MCARGCRAPSVFGRGEPPVPELNLPTQSLWGLGLGPCTVRCFQERLHALRIREAFAQGCGVGLLACGEQTLGQPLAAACELWPMPPVPGEETGSRVSAVTLGPQAEGGRVGTTAWTQYYPAWAGFLRLPVGVP